MFGGGPCFQSPVSLTSFSSPGGYRGDVLGCWVRLTVGAAIAGRLCVGLAVLRDAVSWVWSLSGKIFSQ